MENLEVMVFGASAPARDYRQYKGLCVGCCQAGDNSHSVVFPV